MSEDSEKAVESSKHNGKYAEGASSSDSRSITESISANSSDSEESLTCMETWRRYPKHVFFIVGNEFCERFSYYGMRSVLLLYFRNYLHWDDDTSTAVYHAFTVLAYLFPLIGGIIADSYWGKYKTILYLSLVYIFGHIVKTVGSIPYVPTQVAHVVLSMSGLIFIAMGTGGIKPCVSSFGGDQFQIDQKYIRKQFFSVFYFAINAGSLISTFLTPVFRADVNCYPNEDGPEFDECYALAFGVPAALMVVALIFFVAGTRWYTIYPPEGSVFVKFCKCIYTACKNRWNTPKSERNKDHWLEYANSTPKMIRDTKYVLNVLVLYIPLPFFWALFDQQGSRWTLQAIQTNGHLGGLLIKPDQVEVLNPLLIVTLIPLFEATLYPLLRYFKINFPPLRRMTVGLILAGCSFIAAAILQIEIDKTLTVLPKSNEYGIRFVNAAPCQVTFTPQNYDSVNLPANSASNIFFYHQGAEISYSYTTCDGLELTALQPPVPKEEVMDIILSGTQGSNLTRVEMITEKTEGGGARFSVVNLDPAGRTLIVTAQPLDRGNPPERPSTAEFNHRTPPIDVPYGRSRISIYNKDVSDENFITETTIYMDVGGVYSVFLVNETDNSAEGSANGDVTFHTLDLNPNTISVAWMIPQFVIITVGEVFLSITGLEFSYTQAPPSMKSVLTSIWLFTVSLGNIIVIIIAEVQGIEKQVDEFILFAGLIFAAAIIFIILAYRYVPVNEDEFAEELAEEEAKMRQRAEMHRRKTHPAEAYENEGLELEVSPPTYKEVLTEKPEWETQTPL